MGEILDAGSTVLCPHGGHARATRTESRVLISGAPVSTVSDRYLIDGCQSSAPAGPCTAVRFSSAAVRVRAGGAPVLLRESRAVCEPSGAPATLVVTASRVRGV